MVCKNCGADLKPGIKYCLECGNYIDDEDMDEYYDESGEINSDYKPVTLGDGPRRKRKRRLRLTLSDYLIYAGLLIVMVGSIIVIVVALARSNTQQPVNPTPIVEEQDKKYTIDNYSITVPGGGGIVSTQQNSTLYVSDNVNFTFSYQNTVDDFQQYVNDRSLLEQQLTNNKYEVLSNTEKTVNSRLFLIYEIKVNGVRKILYLTEANSKYTTMGIIELLSNDHWDQALNVIDAINNSIVFDAAS